MRRPLRWYDYITVNVYYLGLTTLTQTNGLVIPLLVQSFVGESQKATYFGRLRLWTLMAALLAQAAMGFLSDRSTLRWGKRRPFIFLGTLLDLALITAVGYSAGMQGISGFIFLFAVVILLQVSSNIAQAAQQGLIPDTVPEEKRGRFSGIKAALELPLPLVLVSFVIAPSIGRGNLWQGLLSMMAVLVTSMLLTMLVPEKRPTDPVHKMDWTPFVRLAIMTALFTLIILGGGEAVNLVGRLFSGGNSVGRISIIMGTVGLAAMLAAIAGGVWVSVRYGLGGEASRHPSFTWWVINRLAFLVGVINLSTFAIYFLQARLNYVGEAAAGPASRLLLLVGVFILLSAAPSGWLSDRIGHQRMVFLSGLIAAFGTLLALLTPSLNLIYSGGCLIGIGAGIFYTANWALGTRLVPADQAGRFLGISNLAGAGAGAVGAYIGGPIADYFSLELSEHPGLGYVVLFTIYGLLFLISSLVITRVKA